MCLYFPLGVIVTTPYFSKRSYIAVPRLSGPTFRTQLTLSILPISADGLILYSSQYPSAAAGDFITLGMKSSRVELRYSLGVKQAVLLSDLIELHRWHTVTVNRLNQASQLYVNDRSVVMGMSPGSYTRLDVVSLLYVGGHSNFALLTENADFVSGFTGCIRNLTVCGCSTILLFFL